MSARSELNSVGRRVVCTGESMNVVRRSARPVTGQVIPTAIGTDQQGFEALFLRQWLEPVTNGRALPSFLAATHPAPDLLSISVSRPKALLPLLRRLLPRQVGGRFVGVPGVRAYLGRDVLELRLLGADNDVRARIRLLGAHENRTQGKALLARAEATWPPGTALHLRRTLAQGEIPWSRPAEAWISRLLSELLRRLPLWRTAHQLLVDIGEHTVDMGWHGGPSAEQVAAVLSSPSCGIGQSTSVITSSDSWRVLRCHADWRSARGPREPWQVWEAVRAAQLVERDRVVVAPGKPFMVALVAWADPTMRNALVERDIGAVFRLLRRQGVTQRQIAVMTGQSQAEVAEILTGRQVTAHGVLVRIADGLGVPRGYLGLEHVRRRRTRMTSGVNRGTRG